MFQVSKRCFVFKSFNETFCDIIFVSHLKTKIFLWICIKLCLFYCFSARLDCQKICENKKETLRVVTIAMICSILASLWKFQYFGDLYRTQSSVYDGAFIAKIVSRWEYSQKTPSQRLAWVQYSSTVLFLLRYKTFEICFFFNFIKDAVKI